MNLVKISNLSHSYDGKRYVLRNINLEIGPGEIVVVVGPSGVGKSTLLCSINRLIQPTQGSVEVLGQEVASAQRTRLREIRRKVGMIFQQFNLFERQKVIENVLLGRLGYINSWKSWLYVPHLVYSRADYELAKQTLKEVGLEKFAFQRVSNLSGGQKQRVAIARVLAQRPEIILADEPVSNLDPYLAQDIIALLVSIARKKKLAVLVSLHTLELAQRYADRIIGLSKGKIIYQGRPQKMTKKIIQEIYGQKI